MKILFVCFSYSIHAARWISLLRGTGGDVHVFPSQDFDALHREFRDVTYWPAKPAEFQAPPGIHVERASPALRARSQGELDLTTYLHRVLEEGGFDLVHSLELQHAGYLTLDATDRLPRAPLWIATNYGSDIFLFGERDEHRERLRELLSSCDYYAAECARDLDLAIRLGFAGHVFALCPNGGGIDLAECTPYRSPRPPSQRRTIAVKGYEHFAGRALAVLGVLDELAPRLREYRIVVHSASPPVRAEAIALAARGRLRIECLEDSAPHAAILALHGQSRISIANSLSDGISTALIEAMAMGSFPIQSRTACADEWIVPGRTGFAPDPEDRRSIRRAIVAALEDDALVDAAAPVNLDTIRRRGEREGVRARVLLAYERAGARAGLPRRGRRDLPLHPPRPRIEVAPERPRLTVITPSYNRADFMAETIESVLAQDFADFEYLIFDDGSRDNTAEVVARFDDPRIRYFHHANAGETTTVNRALRQVAGEFFTIINSDDPAVAGSFSALLGEFEQQPEALMAYPDWYVIDTGSRITSTIRMEPFDLQSLLRANSLPLGPGAMFRSSVLEKVGYRDPLLKYCADLDYIFRVAIAGPIRHVPRLLGTHRVHPGSASLTDRGERLAREALYPTHVYSLHPRLEGPARRTHRSASAAGHFAAACVTPDARYAARLLAQAFLAQPVDALRFLGSFGLGKMATRFRVLGAGERFGAAAALRRAWAAPSRQAALRPLLRAFLLDPAMVLDAAGEVGAAEVARRVRALPVRG